MLLSEFLGRFPLVEELDDGFLVHCPAHQDSHPSLRVAVSDRGKVLLKCRAGCANPDVMKAMGLHLADLARMEPGDVTPKRATSTDAPAAPAEIAALAVRLEGYAQALAWPEDVNDSRVIGARAYAEGRFGITPDEAARLGLGYAEDLGGGPRLVVPFRDRDGAARGFQARALDPDASVRWLGPKSPDGASWSKVGFFPGAAGWEEVLVTEGPGDALTACALGYDAVGVRGAGLASNPSVQDAISALVGNRVAVIAGDSDASGQTFSDALVRALGSRGQTVKRLPIPEGFSDLTEWREADPVAFRRNAVRAVIAAPEERPEAPLEAILRWGSEFVDAATDVAGARLLRDLVRADGSDVRFSPEAGVFLLDRGVWRQDKLDRIRTYAHAVADTLREWLRDAPVPTKDSPEAKKYAALRRYAVHAQTTRGIDSMIRELQALPGVAVDVNAFDARGDLLAVRNGVVNLRTGELQPHDASLLLTRRVDLAYDPDAQAPRWERFLDEVFPAYPDLPAYVRRLIGYGVTGLTTEQCFAVFWGTGANGKSVFTDTLTEVFRELTVTTPFSTFEERGSGGIPNDIAALKGARLVMAAEGEQGRPMAESVLKRVTGRDLIAARFMRKEFFEFRPTFLLLLATNFKPSFRGQDEGLWRRVKLIPWDRYFAPAERDHKLGDALLAEAEGILAWAVRGAREWYAGGLQDPDVIRTSTKEYRETSDALAGFLPGVFVSDPDGGRVTGKMIFDAYLSWADEENLPPRERWTRRTLFGALEERGATKRKAASGVVFEGIRRARQTDAAPEITEPAPEGQRAIPSPLALSSCDSLSHPMTGPSLDDLVD